MGVISTSSAVNEASEQSTAQTEDEQAAYKVGLGLGASVSLTVFFCSGIPLFLLFALMAWRNGVGYRKEEHLLETLPRR